MTSYVGFAEFDAQAQPRRSYIGWAEFDVAAGSDGLALVFPAGGIGGHSRGPRMARFYDDSERKYTIPVSGINESEEEEILMQILMEVARDVIR